MSPIPIPTPQFAPTPAAPNTQYPSNGPAFSPPVYTFLATLVLLLSVSAAIVVRSFILRRRHRLMVEEAIRNGTWVAPAPLTSRASRNVDLSKKPKMWEVYLGQGGFGYGEKGGEEYCAQWDAIQPFSAAYVTPTTSDTQDDHRTGSNDQLPHPATTTTSPPRPFFSRIMNRTPSSTSNPSSFPLTTRTNTITSSTDANNDNTDTPSTTIIPPLAPTGPPTVRVAVLIVMPFQRTQQSHSHSSSHSRSRVTSPSEEEEEQLPYLDVGVAELPVLSTDSTEATDRRKESMGSRESDDV
ncbi:uncharacterized protein LACBIDRAFT_326010 [Laccaria bicolor S238N-H82]|uniref:Predicted protein n=1 Tax=Laccaria bicolor (strain S238N-H82 / ATCC MYA-4686) TaxID=486041 RepID=B0D702_LACBS|nr:uncharacterized protein LACBIDRAFT_326010 [Laccaria bicolor S238N-H82]EDR09313.1 predicted protein [Laccaria bicolor S238N-H82]|eukprot:XP_001879662.1 predicted protein [Laccaria bicolor S238N-H82]